MFGCPEATGKEPPEPPDQGQCHVSGTDLTLHTSRYTLSQCKIAMFSLRDGRSICTRLPNTVYLATSGCPRICARSDELIRRTIAAILPCTCTCVMQCHAQERQKLLIASTECGGECMMMAILVHCAWIGQTLSSHFNIMDTDQPPPFFSYFLPSH